jgi:hypothetical protein
LRPSRRRTQSTIDGWVHAYDHQRPRQPLEMAVPADKFRPNSATRDIVVPAPRGQDDQVALPWANGGIVTAPASPGAADARTGETLACAGVTGTMVLAWITNHRRNGFFIFRPGEGYEYVMTLSLAAVGLAGIGPGGWSLDHQLGWFSPPG